MKLPVPTKMTVRQMVDELVAGGQERSDVSGLTRTQLRRTVKLLRKKQAAKAAESVQKATPEPPVESSPPAKTKEVKKVPKAGVTATKQVTFDPKSQDIKPTDYEWTQFVLGQFRDEELAGENPTIDGLRRIAELYVGRIVSKESDLLDPPTHDNGMRATVKVRVTYESPLGTVSHCGLADVSPENCDPEYARFPSSSAETRAEARCHRSALKLRKVVAAEEMSSSIPLAGDTNGPATPGFIAGLKMMADKAGVSVTKVLTALEIKRPLEKASGSDAKAFLDKLNQFQKLSEIPDEFKA